MRCVFHGECRGAAEFYESMKWCFRIMTSSLSAMTGGREGGAAELVQVDVLKFAKRDMPRGRERFASAIWPEEAKREEGQAPYQRRKGKCLVAVGTLIARAKLSRKPHSCSGRVITLIHLFCRKLRDRAPTSFSPWPEFQLVILEDTFRAV